MAPCARSARTATPTDARADRTAAAGNPRELKMIRERREPADLRLAGFAGAGGERLFVLLQVLVDASPGKSPDEDAAEKLRV